MIFKSNVILRVLWPGLFCIAVTSCGNAQKKDFPDLILVNGNIITVDSKDQIAEAIAINGSKITAVGTTQQIENLAGKATKRIDRGMGYLNQTGSGHFVQKKKKADD